MAGDDPVLFNLPGFNGWEFAAIKDHGDLKMNLQIVEILKIGLSGFCFLMALLGYFLLLREQKANPPRRLMLISINDYIKKTIILGVVVGVVTIALALINTDSNNTKAGALEFMVTIPESLRSDDTSQVSANITKTFNELKELKKQNEEQKKKLTSLKQEMDDDKQEITKLKEEISNQEKEFNKSQEEVLKLSQQVADNEKVVSELKAESFKKDEIIRQNEEVLFTQKTQITDWSSSFLVKIAILNKEIPKFGSSINPRYPFNEEKRKVNKKIQELLAELNYYDGDINGDKEATTNALIKYQKSKGFTELGYLSTSTTTSMVKDHLRSAGVQI